MAAFDPSPTTGPVDALHDRADRLLQGLQGLVLHLHAISGDLPADAPTRRALERWLQSAEQLVDQGCADSGGGGQAGAVALLLGLVVMGRQLPALPQRLRLNLRVGQAPWPLRDGVQQAVGQLACEHVRRRCVDAGASAVSVQLHGTHDALLLRVRDNGRSLQALSGRRGAPAEPALQRGAARLGARLQLWGWPGGGSELLLQLPARRAYDLANACPPAVAPRAGAPVH